MKTLMACAILLGATTMQAAEGVRYLPRTFMDKSLNVPQATVLVPEGWVLEGSVNWTLQPTQPATISMKVRDPKSGARFEVLPTLHAFNARPDYAALLASHAQVSAAKSDVKRLPDGEFPVGSGVTITQHAVSVRGVKGNEECLVTGLFCSVPTPMGWIVNADITMYAAPRGQLDAVLPVLGTVGSSYRIAPNWFAGYLDTLERIKWTVIRNIEEIGRASRYWSARMNEIDNMIMRSWEYKNRVEDRAMQNWSDYMRGVEPYRYDGQTLRLDNRYTWYRHPDGGVVGFRDHVPGGNYIPLQRQ